MERAVELSPPGIVETVKDSDFLMAVLKSARLDADLVEDVADACSMHDLTALHLASGGLTAQEASEKLFLMVDEAIVIQRNAKRCCLKAGVDFGDGSTWDGLDGEPEPEAPPSPPKPTPAPPVEVKKAPLKRADSSSDEDSAGEPRT